MSTIPSSPSHGSTMALPAVSLPVHQLQESSNSRSIQIYDWLITATTNPISNTSELDHLQAELAKSSGYGIPLPEMTFGSNKLRLVHQKSGWTYEFSTEKALAGVKASELEEEDGGVKVGYADAWLKSRSGPSSALPMPKTVATKPYDWTYTTTYAGHEEDVPKYEWAPANKENPVHAIPIAELTRPDPIMFYAEIPLFEDELHDNGSSNLLVRIRVMPTCIFILARFTLRVDGVLFRLRDTRIYHSFESRPPLVVRELSGWEGSYDRVKARLPRRDDLTPLTDPNFIYKTLSTLEHVPCTKWRGLGTKTEVVSLQH